MPHTRACALLEIVKQAKLFKYERETKVTKVWYGGNIVYEYADNGDVVGSHWVDGDADAIYNFMRFDRW